MKNFEIQCIVYDKNNPSDPLDAVIDISLNTVIQAENEEIAMLILSNFYSIKETISIQEIL